MREVADLWSARTADELHRILVLHPPIRRSADADEAFALLQKHHETEPSTSAVTAILLVTDLRWRGGVGDLVRRIAESDILDEEQLDLLTRTFLAADEAVYWQLPDEWLGDEVIVVVIDEDHDVSAVSEEESVPDGPTVVRREVAPPLRRWAAAHAARRDSGAWGPVLARARALDARRGAAVAAGLLDAIDSLVPQVQELLVTEAIQWPDQAVRRLGLARIAEQQGPEAAYALAKDDPNARIRAWADSLMSPSPAAERPTAAGSQRRVAPRDDAPEPPTLF
ncbi:MAG: hypothetical protein KY452_00460 [Actinobacteria bacterium]|nr:hypothetical protein [Actinomycetota bacterium]